MDILSDDGTQLIERLKSWEEMYDRVRYKKDIDPKEVKILRIISDYDMPEEGKCGLKTCHADHKLGYLVICKMLTGKGVHFETNIGHICGKNIFGHSFEEHRSAYKKDLNTLRYRDLIIDQICNIEKHRDVIKTLLKNGGTVAYASVRNLFENNELNPTIVKKLKRRADKTDGLVIASHQATKEEIMQEEAIRGKEIDDTEAETLTTQTELGRIAGIRAASDYIKIKQELIVEIPALLNELEKVEPEKLHYSDLSKWSKRLNGLDSRINQVDEYIEDCKRFTLASNIKFIKENEQWL